MNISSPIQTKKFGGRNLVLGLVSMFSVAVLGLSGTAFAVNNGGGDSPTNGAPTSKEDCKNGDWRQFGFKNQGQCIKWVNSHGAGNGNGGGNGYGGGNGNNVSTSIDLDVSGDNNVISIIINYLFG